MERLAFGPRHLGQFLRFAQHPHAPCRRCVRPKAVKRTTRRVRSTKRDPKQRLELAQTGRERGLCDVGGVGGLAEMPVLAERDEILELLEGRLVNGHDLSRNPINPRAIMDCSD